MTDEELDAIEHFAEQLQRSPGFLSVADVLSRSVLTLVAEVRWLRRDRGGWRTGYGGYESTARPASDLKPPPSGPAPGGKR